MTVGVQRNVERKSQTAIDDLQRRQQREVLVDDVRRIAGVGGFRVKQPCELLAEMPARKADRTAAMHAAGEHRRLEQSLQIDHRVIVGLAELAQRLAKPSPSCSVLDRARIDADAAVDPFDEVQQLDVPGINHPVDARVRKFLAQRRGDRNPVDDISERSQTHDQKAVHLDPRAIRESRSRVE